MKNILLLLAILAAFATLDSFASSCISLSEMQKDIFKQLNQEVPVINSKKEIKIAVIDTGIDYNNEALRSALWVPRGKVSASNYGEDLVKKTKKPQDTHGHGTHIAGIIASLFPQAKIYAINYYTTKPSHKEANVGVENLERFTRAIEMAVEANVDIINISGGGPEYSSEEHEIIKKAKKKNILVVSAGGNEGYRLSEKQTYYPAQYKEENILSVANLNKMGFKDVSSNYGEEIQVGALGRIKSYGLDKDCRQVLRGTSQSTAVVSALAAMIKSENPQLTAAQIKEIIVGNAQSSGGFEKGIVFAKRSPVEGRKVATNPESSVKTEIMNVILGK